MLVGRGVGVLVVGGVGFFVGVNVGLVVGLAVGSWVDASVGIVVGDRVGRSVGTSVGPGAVSSTRTQVPSPAFRSALLLQIQRSTTSFCSESSSL